MIDILQGELVARAPDAVTLSLGGIAFRVRIPLSTYEALPPVGGQTRLFTHLHVRDDELALFGFASELERQMFRMLIGVNHVGPMVAMRIVSACPPDRFKGCIADGDADSLQAMIKGVGAKMARRLVVELQSRVDELSVAPLPTHSDEKLRDSVQALVALGEPRAAAEKAVKAALDKLGPDADSQALIQQALSAR